MVENVIEIVDVAPNLVAGAEWPCVAIRFVKLGVESAEQRRHRDIGFSVADIESGIEDHRLAAREHRRVAGPEFAMQQRRLGVAGVGYRRYRADHGLASPRRPGSECGL